MSQEADVHDDFYSPEQLSERLGGTIKPRTLANWRTSGTGPKYVKLGGKVAYPKREVEAWIAKRTVQSTSQYRV